MRSRFRNYQTWFWTLFRNVILLFVLSEMVDSRPVSAKPKEDYSIPVPPSSVSDRVEVFVGEPQTIPLKVSGRIEEPLRFLIRKKPRQGSLGEVRRTGQKTAEVLYSPASDAKSGEDFFTFAVQSVDSPVSAPARIDIDLRLRPAVLDYPRSLDFGAVPLGDSARLDFVVSNTGGKAAALQIRANPPWTLAETPPDWIKAGGQAVIGLIFEPGASGDFSERLAITSEGSEVVTLHGSGTEALSCPPQGLIISSEMRAGAQAIIPFTNRTATDRIVEFEWPGNIIASPALRIPAGETIQVSVALDAYTPPSFSTRSMVPFRSGNFTALFPLVIEPAPAGFAISPNSPLELGRVALRETAGGKFVVSNPGGQPVGLRSKIPEGLSIRPDPSGVLIDPGMSQEFEVSHRPQKSGPFRHFLSIGPSDGEMGTIIIQGEGRAALPVEKLLDFPTAPVHAAAPKQSVAAIAPVEELFLNESAPESIQVQWKVTSPAAKNFYIERQEITAGANGQPLVVWKRWEGVNVEIMGDTATAHFRKLPPNSFWRIRIIGVDSNGLVGQTPEKNFRISTTSVNLWKVPFWISIPGTIALIFVFAGLGKKLKKSD